MLEVLSAFRPAVKGEAIGLSIFYEVCALLFLVSIRRKYHLLSSW